ncbi:MAG TPA: hypothetical protein VN420_05700 [Candidatus Fimivivens sp.]|nr:hypothetical protein [Candidatus Fimivivens sp.]
MKDFLLKNSRESEDKEGFSAEGRLSRMQHEHGGGVFRGDRHIDFEGRLFKNPDYKMAVYFIALGE